jgi:hypothetical protein
MQGIKETHNKSITKSAIRARARWTTPAFMNSSLIYVSDKFYDTFETLIIKIIVWKFA